MSFELPDDPQPVCRQRCLSLFSTGRIFFMDERDIEAMFVLLTIQFGNSVFFPVTSISLCIVQVKISIDNYAMASRIWDYLYE